MSGMMIVGVVKDTGFGQMMCWGPVYRYGVKETTAGGAWACKWVSECLKKLGEGEEEAEDKLNATEGFLR